MKPNKQKDSVFSLFFQFISKHSSGASLYLLFLGSVIAGIIEILGILILYYLIRVLLSYDKLSSSHVIKRFFYQFGVEEKNETVLWLGVLITVIFVFKNIFLIYYYYYQNIILKKWKVKLSKKLMTGYLHAKYERMLSYDSATLVRNINSLIGQAINGFVLSGLTFFSNILIAAIILSLFMYKYLFVTALISSVLFISSFFQNIFLKKKSQALGDERDALLADQNRSIFQGIYSIKETKVYGKENFFINNFLAVNNRTVHNDTKSLLLTRAPTHITEIIMIISIVIICSVVIIDNIDNPEMSVATLGILAAISFRIAPIMNRTVVALQGLNKNLSSLKKLNREFEWIDKTEIPIESSGLEKPKNTFKKDICFENVSYKYKAAKESVFKGLNITINKGEFIGIVGESGAGKTTLVNLLLGLLEPEEGQISIDSKPLKTVLSDWRKQIGYVPQDVYISDDSLENNIAFGLSESDIDQEKVIEAIKAANLNSLYKDDIKNLKLNLGENGKKISGGQRQRVGIARAFYRGAKVLILDEPTSALDVETEEKIIQTINTLTSEMTVIFITHRLSTVTSTDRILLMKENNVTKFDTFDNLVNSDASFKKMAQISKIIN